MRSRYETVILTVAVAIIAAAVLYFPCTESYVGQQYFRSGNRASRILCRCLCDYHDPECGAAGHRIF